jgi:rare lipoprotein A
VTAQREIEMAVRDANAKGQLKGSHPLPAKADVTVGGITSNLRSTTTSSWREDVQARSRVSSKGRDCSTWFGAARRRRLGSATSEQRRLVREKLSILIPASSLGDSAGHASSGVASVYSGRQTASGEMMDPGKMTAAHPTLPFGIQITVVNHSNGRSTVVRINDRGPFVRGRVIDLSPGAGRALGVDGLAHVSLIVGNVRIDDKAKRPPEQPPATKPIAEETHAE